METLTHQTQYFQAKAQTGVLELEQMTKARKCGRMKYSLTTLFKKLIIRLMFDTVFQLTQKMILKTNLN